MLGERRVEAGIVAAVVLIMVSVAFVLVVWDPKVRVHLRNDYATAVDLSFCGGTSAAPGRPVSFTISVFDPFPCYVYSGTEHSAHPIYLGCLQFNPLIDRQSVLSSFVSDLSEERCWETAPR